MTYIIFSIALILVSIVSFLVGVAKERNTWVRGVGFRTTRNLFSWIFRKYYCWDRGRVRK
jgi:hypothetical protein